MGATVLGLTGVLITVVAGRHSENKSLVSLFRSILPDGLRDYGTHPCRGGHQVPFFSVSGGFIGGSIEGASTAHIAGDHLLRSWPEGA